VDEAMKTAHQRKLDAEMTRVRFKQARIFGQVRRAAIDPDTPPEKLRLGLTMAANAGEALMLERIQMIYEIYLLRRGMSPRNVDKVLKEISTRAKRGTKKLDGER
jgi:hypothetical protein